MDVTVQFMAKLPVKLTPRKKWVLASCPILDVHSQGKTAEAAKKNLAEALSLFFISCFERGTLDTALKQCGFKPLLPPAKYEDKPSISKEEYIDVPIPFVVSQADPDECHA
jgi:predicted RNase H-like HicB family nuclease